MNEDTGLWVDKVYRFESMANAIPPQRLRQLAVVMGDSDPEQENTYYMQAAWPLMVVADEDEGCARWNEGEE